MKRQLLGLWHELGSVLIVAAIGLVVIGGVALVRHVRANQVVVVEQWQSGAPGPR